MDPGTAIALGGMGMQIMGGFGSNTPLPWADVLNRFGGQILGGPGAPSLSDQIMRAETAEQVALQKEFAQHGVQWRVQDAIAAGVHPLYALGANIPTFSPVQTAFEVPRSLGRSSRGGGDPMMQAIGAVSSFAQAYYRNQALEVNSAAQREKDYAQAEYYRALASKELQSLNAQPPVPDSVVRQGTIGMTGQTDPMFNTVEIKAAPTFSRHSEVQSSMAGSKPMWQPWQLRDSGLMMDVPWSDEGPMESLREMPVWFMPEFVKHNMERYGANWLVDFLQGYPDSPVMSWLLGESVR